MRTTQNGNFVLLPLVCRALSAQWRSVGAVAPERVVASFLRSRFVSCTCALLLDVHLDSCDRTHSRLIQNSHIHCTIFNILHAARFTSGYVPLAGQELAPSKCVSLSTSREVRKDMKDWVLSLDGHKWSVKFDVRDLGGHLDTTFRGWSSTLAARVRLVISRLVLLLVLPLDFHDRVRVVWSMYLPASLHGIEASLLASDSLRKLRSSVCGAVWSRRQPLANVGAVLSLLDGPTGCDPCFCVVWFRFRLLRRYLALWPAEVGRICRILGMIGEGCPGHGPLHLLSASAAEIGFFWDPDILAWVRPGLPPLSSLAGPVQPFLSCYS